MNTTNIETTKGNWREMIELLNLSGSTIKLTWDHEIDMLLLSTIYQWGTQGQVLTIAEEAMEYAHACIRYVSRPALYKDSIDRLVDETADMLLVMAQMEAIMAAEGPLDWKERVLERLRFKVERLRGRLMDSNDAPEVNG